MISRACSRHDENPRKCLLEQIHLQSEILKTKLLDLKNLIWDRKIVTYYETQQTRKLEWVRSLVLVPFGSVALHNSQCQDASTQSWGRTGAYITAVDTDSAILQLPGHTEDKISLCKSLTDCQIQQ